MKAIFYYNKSDNKECQKTIEYIAEMDIVLKTASSLKNPVLDLEMLISGNITSDDIVDDDADYVVDNNSDDIVYQFEYTPFDFNYCYIPSLKRYYYMESPILITPNLFRYALTEDVLMSHYSKYSLLEGFISRNEFDYDEQIKDDLTNFKWNKNILYINVSNYDNDKTFKNNETYNIVMTYLTSGVIGGNFPQGQGIRAPYNKSTNYLVCNYETAKNLSNLIYRDDTKRSFIKSMMVYPYLVDNKVTGISEFKIGNETINVGDTFPYGEVYRDINFVPSYFSIGHFNSIDLHQFDNFLGREPYTKYMLWLPFHKFIEIDSEDLIGKGLDIRYIVDYDSGKATVVVASISASIVRNIIYTADIQLGVDIPLSTTNQREANDKALSMGLNTGIGLIGSAMSIASMNPVGIASGVMSATKTVSSAITGFNTNYVKAQGMDTSSSSSYYYSLRPFLKVVRNIPVGYDESYFKLKGRPLMQTRTLSTLHGYTEVSEIHLDNLDIFEDEKVELESLLKSGIIL